MNIVETKDLYFTYPDGDGRKIILNDVSVSFELGKFYTILGSSGSGKTTFLSLIAALDK
ncbi:ATP-binding cassette domain-containing protein, partial [uncultured Traorella sp.]|uniref:ATP-binding cassette domain-containing protein n=1 Tax=uncultured Traorella sp. TaxID=1929048 RepID=UPI0025EC9BFD